MDTSTTVCFIVCRLIENSSVQVGTLHFQLQVHSERGKKTRIFILIINLISDLKKYKAIFSHLKKRMSRYSRYLKIRKYP